MAASNKHICAVALASPAAESECISLSIFTLQQSKSHTVARLGDPLAGWSAAQILTYARACV